MTKVHISTQNNPHPTIKSKNVPVRSICRKCARSRGVKPGHFNKNFDKKVLVCPNVCMNQKGFPYGQFGGDWYAVDTSGSKIPSKINFCYFDLVLEKCQFSTEQIICQREKENEDE
jgi:hypothetical protein